MISWAEHVTHIGEERNVWTVSVGKSKGKGSLRKLIHRWKGRIRMDPGRDQIGRGWSVESIQ
jgi:hypothetical protein